MNDIQLQNRAERIGDFHSNYLSATALFFCEKDI